MSQLSIDFTRAQIHGSDYKPERDRARLTGQLEKIYELMKDGKWRTLEEVAKKTGAPSPSVSAQMRTLRKEPFYMTVEKRHVGGGLYEYSIKS